LAGNNSDAQIKVKMTSEQGREGMLEGTNPELAKTSRQQVSAR
jgi:hypothetical protein